jgi:hypothetical protein
VGRGCPRGLFSWGLGRNRVRIRGFSSAPMPRRDSKPRGAGLWRLHADGTIRARFGFAAVDDTCVLPVTTTTPTGAWTSTSPAPAMTRCSSQRSAAARLGVQLAHAASTRSAASAIQSASGAGGCGTGPRQGLRHHSGARRQGRHAFGVGTSGRCDFVAARSTTARASPHRRPHPHARAPVLVVVLALVGTNLVVRAPATSLTTLSTCNDLPSRVRLGREERTTTADHPAVAERLHIALMSARSAPERRPSPPGR